MFVSKINTTAGQEKQDRIVASQELIALLKLPDPLFPRAMARNGGVAVSETRARDSLPSTPEILIEVSRDHPEAASERAAVRPLLHAAMADDRAAVELQLREEEAAERERDRIYWEPLRRELEVLRHGP